MYEMCIKLKNRSEIAPSFNTRRLQSVHRFDVGCGYLNTIQKSFKFNIRNLTLDVLKTLVDDHDIIIRVVIVTHSGLT